MPTLSNTSPSKAVMEPRIRLRRAHVRRQEGRRRLRIVVAVVVVLALGAGSWAATRSPLLDVDHIVVDGAPQTGRGAAIKAAGVQRGAALVDVDEGAVERRLRALPWVRSAVAHREWPGTLQVAIVERAPVAMTRSVDGGWALVDVQGRVLSWSKAPVPGVLIVAGVPPVGPPGTTLAPEARGLLELARALPEGLRPFVTSASLEAGGLSLGLAPQGAILLGGPDDLTAKLRAAQLVLEGVETTRIAVLDVRLPNTPTLTRVQP
jgi:cell division protein FtsQ